jgi:protein-S-isoprenylcysteine O-methyltransferase Ste14
MSASTLTLLLSGPVIGIGLWRYRADLRQRGHATPLGVTALLAAWLMPHLVLGFAFPMFPAPRSTRQWTGYALMVLGLVACALVLWRRFSPAMVVGSDARTLVTGGPYRWSRNPQYIAYAPFPVGYALTGAAFMGWVGVAVYLVVVQLTVLIEEEHLTRTFGARYHAYRAATPRYLLR